MSGKRLLAIVAIYLSLLALGAVTARGGVPAETPDSAVCATDMDADACTRFTNLLHDFGHDGLTVVSGAAVGTYGDLKKNTYTVYMRCVDKAGFVTLVIIRFVDDNLAGISLKPTENRQLGA